MSWEFMAGGAVYMRDRRAALLSVKEEWVEWSVEQDGHRYGEGSVISCLPFFSEEQAVELAKLTAEAMLEAGPSLCRWCQAPEVTLAFVPEKDYKKWICLCHSCGAFGFDCPTPEEAIQLRHRYSPEEMRSCRGRS